MLRCRKIGAFRHEPRTVRIGSGISVLDRVFRIAPALVGALVIAAPAAAQDGPAWRALWPVPQSALTPPGADGIEDLLARDEAAEVDADADAALFAVTPMGQARRDISRGRSAAQRPVPLDIIREGLHSGGPVSAALPERAVGMRLGADIFAVSTRIVSPAGTDRTSDARIDWRLARPVANTGPGFIWTVSTGGGGGVASHPEQNANLLVGFRQPVFAHLTLTSQLTLQGNYVFAPGDGAHSALAPEIQLSADLTALAGLPFEAAFDLGLARQMPLLASQYETRGSAMLRVRYAFE
jgi:hypothetical protein